MADVDPSELTDEQLKAEIEGKEVAEPEAPEEETPEAEVEEETPEPEVVPTEEKEEERPQSRREALRIAKLVEKQVQQRQQAPELSGIDYGKTLDADPEVIAQLEADRRQVGSAQYEQGLKQAQSIQFQTRLEIDAPKVETKYPQLDKESDRFNPVVANALNSHYLNLVGYDPQTGAVERPNLRYADFIEAQFELADELASDKVTKTSKNVAKQAASTGLRPDGSSAKRLNLNKPPEQMTDEELQAIIGQAIPTK